MNQETQAAQGNPYLIPGAIVIAGLLIAGAVFTKQDAPEQVTQGTSEIQAEILPVTERDHIRGAENPDIYLVEYSDFRCGFCGVFHNTVTQLLDEYDGQLAWVYRHTPYQPGGMEAAVASECIAEQLGEEGFWQYADLAFENQRSLSDAWHRQTAEQLGADGEAFAECYTSGRYDELIASHADNAEALGGRGTPYNVLLTREGGIIKFSGAQPIENVKVFINRALKSLE